jgi:NADH-quinone oxidoreductase subunit M
LAGTFISQRPYAIIAAVGVVLAAVYMLWAFQRVFTGKPTGENAKMTDATKREILLVAPLLALSLFLGLYPKPVLERIEPTVKQKIAFLEQKTDYRQKRPHGFGSNKFGGESYKDLAKKALKEQQ